jgi:hypothetical protein
VKKQSPDEVRDSFSPGDQYRRERFKWYWETTPTVSRTVRTKAVRTLQGSYPFGNINFVIAMNGAAVKKQSPD